MNYDIKNLEYCIQEELREIKNSFNQKIYKLESELNSVKTNIDLISIFTWANFLIAILAAAHAD